MNTTTVASHLNIAESLIRSIEEWANVLFVRFVSGSPRFVSKKALKKEMPALEGSEKQIAWGQDIREQAISWLKRQKHLPGNVFSEGCSDADKERLMARAAKRTKASWWIDRRNEIRNGGIWDYV